MIPQPIEQVPLFSRLSSEERELVTARLRRRQAASGEAIFSAGQPSDALYVITAGWVKLEEASSGRAATLANLGAGSLLGEVDTLMARPYTTTGRAAANTQLLALSRADLQDLISQHPSIGLKFSSTLGVRIAFLEEYLVQQRLRNISLLSSLSEDDLRAIAQRLDILAFARGDVIVQAGAPGDAVYLVEEGQVQLVSTSSEGESFEELGEGELFGHTALVTGKAYPATARALTDVSVWLLTRSLYQEVIRERSAVKLAFSRSLAETLGPSDQTDALEHIRQLPLFSDVPPEALNALVSRLVLRHFPSGEVIYGEGTPGDALYIVESGEVQLMDSAFSDAQLLERMGAGESFGEMALLTGRTRAECARVSTDTTVWVLYKSDFDDLMVRYPEISVSLSRAISQRLATRENDFVVRHLRRIALFSNLTSSELRAISNKVHGLRFRPGEIICFAGEPAQNMYMIEMGEVRRLGVGSAGEPVLIDLLGPGDSFGEQAVMENSAYATTAQAIGDVELWTISKVDFLRLLQQYPSLAVTVTRMMADRMSNTQAMPTMRNTGGMPTPRPGGTPRPGAPPPRRSPPPSRPAPKGPPRIQRPLSGARPIPKPPSSKPPTRSQATLHPDDDAPTLVTPRSRLAPPPADDAPTIVQRRSQIMQPARDESPTLVQRRPAVVPVVPRWPSPAERGTAKETTAPRRAPRPNLFLQELAEWFVGLSFGAKIRAAALTALLLWFVLIALPATAITTVSSAFGGLQVFQPASQPGAPTAKPIVVHETTTSGGKSKIAYVITETPVPTKTRVPATPTRKPAAVPATRAPAQPTSVAAAAGAVPTAAPVPVATLPPSVFDSRLGPGGLPHLESVKVEPANVAHGQKFWRAISVKFEDINESGNDHTIYVKVLGEDGKRVDGKKAHLTSVGGLSEYPDEKPAGDMCDCNYNYPMYGDGYAFNIEDQYPSDKVSGMVMPMRRHVNYRVIFQLTTMP